MFQKESSLATKALLSYQASLLKEESPLQKPTNTQQVNQEERIDNSMQNTGSKIVGNGLTSLRRRRRRSLIESSQYCPSCPARVP